MVDVVHPPSGASGGPPGMRRAPGFRPDRNERGRFERAFAAVPAKQRNALRHHWQYVLHEPLPTAAAVLALSDADLLAIRGLGPRGVRALRTHLRACAAARPSR